MIQATGRIDITQLVRSSTSESLPAEYVEITARRLGKVAAATGNVFLVYLILYRTVWVNEANAVGMSAGIAGLLVSMAVAGFLLLATRPAAQVTAVAVTYEIFLTLMLALSESWSVDYAVPSAQVPWTCVVIALFPYLIPGSPRLTLFASMACAATVPLGIALLCVTTDRVWPATPVVASYVLPAFLCAFLAWAPTTALHRMGVAVQQARRLGNYELTERLGHGGMGEVWRAKHRLLARPAAVKLIKPEMLGATSTSARDSLMRRFEKEAQATATLDSPHTVELYDFGVSPQGVLFYVMELLHGVDVQTLVEKFGPLPSERVVHLLMQACDSLEDAHERGLVHRDIKPANLFLARKGGVCDFLKVLDFGLVKRWRSDGINAADLLDSIAQMPTQQTALGQIVGTPAFLAPEAALGEQAIDGRADLYALGCVGYWMLTGAMVFEESGPVAMAVAHVTKEPMPPSQRVSFSIDAQLEQVVLSCLQKDREHRPSTATALREQLAAIALSTPWSRERAAAWWHEHLTT